MIAGSDLSDQMVVAAGDFGDAGIAAGRLRIDAEQDRFAACRALHRAGKDGDAFHATVGRQMQWSRSKAEPHPVRLARCGKRFGPKPGRRLSVEVAVFCADTGA